MLGQASAADGRPCRVRFGRTRRRRQGGGTTVSVAIAEGRHPVPFRTRKLSPPAPMVLPWRRGGRVGRRRDIVARRAARQGGSRRCTPSMGVDQGVRVPEGKGSMNPVAEGNGVVVRRGRKEAGGEPASRGTRTAYGGQVVRASLQRKAKPELPRDGRGKRGGCAGKAHALIWGDLLGCRDGAACRTGHRPGDGAADPAGVSRGRSTGGPSTRREGPNAKPRASGHGSWDGRPQPTHLRGGPGGGGRR